MNLDEVELQSDPKYKNYVTAVEKALKGFEYSSEWADLISALGKLIKVLQANSRYNIIPKRLLIGKRLAQCTHPALPSGVHLKALETYDLIFKTIGPKLLCQDMFIYSAGIFPLLSYAAMPVKPKLLNLYEEHYLPLGEHLKPSLTGLLQGILPGLEEGSDHNDSTQTLLEQLCAGMVKSNFYSALWDCVLHSPSVRLPAIAFVLSQVDRKVPMKEQAYIMGNNKGLLVESVCSALYDNVALVQRNILDLILVLFPIHNACIPLDNITKILTAALNVLLRRDMSLNRRLYAWLLGNDTNSTMASAKPKPGKHNRSDSNITTDSIMSTEDEMSEYFETYSKTILIQSLKTWLHRTPQEPAYTEKKSSVLKPYRLLISLIDKPEVSATIIDDIFIEVFRALYNKCTGVTEGSKVRREVPHGADRPTDLIKTANMLFGTFEAYFMWDFIARKFEKCCQESVVKSDGGGNDGSNLSCSELCKLVDFLLDIVSLETYIETPTEFLPQLLCKITMSLTNYCPYLSLEEINDGLHLCAKLLTKVQPSMVLSPDPVDEDTEDDDDDLRGNHLSDWEMVEDDKLQVGKGSRSLETLTSSKSSRQSLDKTLSSGSEREEVESDAVRSGGDAGENHNQNHVGDGFDDKIEYRGTKGVPLSPERSLDRLSTDPNAEILHRENEDKDDSVKLDKAKRPTRVDSLSLHSDPGSDTRHAIDSKLRAGSISSLTASLTESELETAPVFLMQACVQCFQSFFFKFVSRKILPSADTIKAYISKLQVGQRAGLDSRKPGNGSGEDILLKLPKGLEELLEREQSENGRIRTDSVLTNDSSTANYLDDVTLECDGTATAVQAFSTACHLLVEFACFPMYCNETVSAALLKTPKIKGNVMSLPEWLQSLLACCCFVYSFPIQSIAISTTIELIGLTKSVTGGSSDNALVLPNPPNSPKADSGTISVVLIPAISTSHLDCLNYSSNFFQRVSVNLWYYLGSRTPDHHQKSADLLHQLHNVTPDVFICEDVIGNSLVQNKKIVCLESHSKFATLWHLVRAQILSSSPASKLRTFDRSLFVMMDSLEHSDCMVRSVTQTWLVNAINRGDIARILEPVVLVLLHPATARVSVQFLQTRTQQEKERKEAAKAVEDQEAAENRIYSISSINGEVKYYVVKDGKRALAISPGNKDPVFACTAMDEKHKYVTKTNMGLRYTPPSHALNKTLSVTVNPMSQQAYYSDSDSDHSAPLHNSVMKVPALTMTKAQSLDEHNLRRFSSPMSSAIGISNKRGERRRSEQADRKSDQSSPPSSQSLMDDKLSHSASTDDLSDGENFEEPSYFYNEEVNETLEDAVRGVLASIIDQVVMEVEGPDGFIEEAMEAQESPQRKTPRKLPLGAQGGVGKGGQGEKLSPDDIGLDDLESAMSGLETEQSDVEGGMPSVDAVRKGSLDDNEAKMLTGLKLHTVRPLQQHILLYVQVYDAQRMLYVLATLKSILNTNPRPFVCAMSSTSISSTNTPQLIKLQQVLARHKRCITGRDFYCELEPEALTLFRSSTYLEIVILMCVYFMRSYYPQDLKATQSDVEGNRDVQIASMEVLGHILHELVDVVKDSGRGLATFISDLLSRCKVQKAVLYCLLATVFHSRKRSSKHNNSKEKDIIQDVPKDLADKGAQAFQVQLLKLSHTIIILEDQLFSLKDDTDTGIHQDNEWECYRIKHQPHNSLAFLRTARLSCQGILLTAMLSALKQPHNCHMHRHWVSLVTDSLPYLEYGLPKMAIPVTNQLCRNLELLSTLYGPQLQSADSKKKPETELDNVPPDHVINMLEGLTTICHFCMLENTSSLSAMSGRHTGASSAEPESTSSAPLLSSLFGALTRDRSKSTTNQSSNQSNTPKSEARKGLLGMLPRIIASVAKLWAMVQKCERSRDATRRSEEASSLSFGSPKSARQQIMELLSPIALHHAGNLLAAIGVVWSDCKKRHKVKQQKVIPAPSEEQLVLVELVSAIRALPSDTLVQTIKQVLKAPPFTIKDKNQPGLEVSMLQFLYCYIQRMTVSPLRDSWHSVLSLLKEGLQLNLTAPGQFLLLGILNEIIPKITPFDERKEQRDLQEICHRLIEACNLIAGSSLEQTTWLRRNVYVKIQEEQVAESDASDSAQGGADSPTEVTAINPEQIVSAPTSAAITKSYSQYSVQALTLLAGMLSQMLDLVYQSDEKEKVVPLLAAIMHNVTPYLKNHSAPNMPSYRACTALVSSLSGYQYTRRAWKRDAFDLLLDPSFFHMDAISIRGWRSIVDNLMTHDKTTFRDLMARVAAFQNTSLNPFASREAEMDQRAQLLKRLSYTLFCSEIDQYVRALPDIQERLSESLRLSQVPCVHEQVFLCFRVLLLRISPHHLTGLWPTMISEMVQVFLYLEEQLAALNFIPDTGKKSAFKRVASSDLANFFLGNSNTPKGLASIPRSWLGLYLAACKFLDLALCLPSDDIPQFQVYKWAFIGETSKRDSETQFVPHIARAAKLLRARLRMENGVNPPAAKAPRGRPLITTQNIKSVTELLPFFNAVCPTDQPIVHNNDTQGMANGVAGGNKEAVSPGKNQQGAEEDAASFANCPIDEYIERMVERDFLVYLG